MEPALLLYRRVSLLRDLLASAKLEANNKNARRTMPPGGYGKLCLRRCAKLPVIISNRLRMVNLLDMKYRDVLANLCFYDRIQDSREHFV